jgi:hypothetical protein
MSVQDIYPGLNQNIMIRREAWPPIFENESVSSLTGVRLDVE